MTSVFLKKRLLDADGIWLLKLLCVSVVKGLELMIGSVSAIWDVELSLFILQPCAFINALIICLAVQIWCPQTLAVCASPGDLYCQDFPIVKI